MISKKEQVHVGRQVDLYREKKSDRTNPSAGNNVSYPFANSPFTAVKDLDEAQSTIGSQ